jgi:hypothetical protein
MQYCQCQVSVANFSGCILKSYSRRVDWPGSKRTVNPVAGISSVGMGFIVGMPGGHDPNKHICEPGRRFSRVDRGVAIDIEVLTLRISMRETKNDNCGRGLALNT